MTHDLVKRAEIKSGMLKMGESIAFGSDAAIIDELLDALEAANARVKELEAKLQNSTLTVVAPIGIGDDLKDVFNNFWSRQQGPL